jgi:hypothetical protein
MQIRKIKIAHQGQADKPIYLLANGSVECGKFKYAGRYKEEFKLIFLKIYDLVPGEQDVSNYKYWDAIKIYDNFVVANWLESVDAEQIEKFAIETEIRIMLERIRAEFKLALGARWKRIFKNSDPNDPETPKQAWQIL